MEVDKPFRVGIAVCQLAKLRVLQFYYDCLDKFLDRRDFQLIQIDTDSLHFGLSCNSMEEAVSPAMLEEFRASKKEWLVWDKWSERKPGLFKLEFEGTCGIALCSKCYFMEDENEKGEIVLRRGP